MEADKTEIRIAGFGGQGVILSGMIMGKAACLFEGRNSTMIQSFGPEARGGSCSAQVVVSSQPIMYPYIKQADVLVVMSQEALRLFGSEVKPGGLILYESDLVELRDAPKGVRCHGIPATRLAEEIKSKILLNIVMLGFFAAFASGIGVDAMKKAIADSVPKGTEPHNIKAFESGYNYGKGLLKTKEGNA
jgi:2-oxoglutarate ferredoxin oxidoreductase subunit gamma